MTHSVEEYENFISFSGAPMHVCAFSLKLLDLFLNRELLGGFISFHY
jgi:hypothetical protein